MLQPLDDSESVWVERGAMIDIPPSCLSRVEVGEVTVFDHGRPIEVWRAPVVLDVAGALGGGRSFRFQALTRVRVSHRPLVDVPHEVLLDALVEENERLSRRVRADVLRDDDTFLPWARLVPGPWHFKSAHAYVLLMQGDPSRVRRCLPRGVWSMPRTGGRYLLAVTRFEGVTSLSGHDGGQFSYHEVTPFVPVWSGLRGPATFVPELYPDAWMAVLLGREIHGFPKRTARIGFHEDGGELLVDRRVALRVRFDRIGHGHVPEVLADIAGRLVRHRAVPHITASLLKRRRTTEGLGFAALVHKRIGSPESAGSSLQLDQLVRVPVTLDAVTEALPLEGLVVEVGEGPGILHGRALAGWSLRSGFRFGAGAVERRGSGRPE